MNLRVLRTVEDFPDVLYHGTTESAIASLERGISLNEGRHRSDFGNGFYLTSNYYQAKSWAIGKMFYYNQRELSRRKIHPNHEPFIVEGAIIKYSLKKDVLQNLNGLFFDEPNEHWARFILGNRSKSPDSHIDFHNRDNKYDFVYGPLADNAISILIKEHDLGKINDEEFLLEVVGTRFPFPMDHQISIHTEVAKNSLTMEGVELHGKQQWEQSIAK